MATTTNTIYNWLAQRVAEQPTLAGLSPHPDSSAQLSSVLSSGSRVAVWRLLLWCVAYVHKVQEDNFDRFRAEVAGLAKEGHYGTRRWFVAKAKAFQLGHVLQFTPLDAGYDTDDPAARIVAQAAVVELANVVVVKVAKTSGDSLTKLTNAELVAVSDYFQEIRPPVQVTVLTADADRVRLTGSVVYDGQQPVAGVQAAVDLALKAYFKGLDFGGVITLTSIRRTILAVPGVVDLRLDAVHVRTTGPWQPIPRVHYTYAGHAVIDPAEPITSSLQWAQGNV